MVNQEPNLIDYIYVLVKRRKIIMLNFFTVVVIVAGITLTLPKTYSAESIILPVSATDDLMTPMGMQGFGSNLLGFGGSEEANRLIAILESRSVMHKVATKFNLVERYETETFEETIGKLRKMSDISLQDDGTIVIRISTVTPFLSNEDEEMTARKLSADMTNAFVEELDRMNKELKTKQGRLTRIFIENRLNYTKSELSAAEDSIKIYQKRFGTVSLPEQIVAAIQTAAELKRSVVAQEVKLHTLRIVLGEKHPDVVLARIEFDHLSKKLDEMKFNSVSDTSSKGLPLFPSFADMPELAVRYLQLERNLKVQSAVFEFLVKQFEEAKIKETKDTPTLMIIDEAVQPERRSKPRRTLIVLISGLATIILSVILVFLLESLETLKIDRPGDYSKINEILRALLPWRKE